MFKVLLLILGLLSCNAALGEEIYTSKEGGYSVAFPGTPKEIEVPETSKFVDKVANSIKNGGLYSVKYTDYPEENVLKPEKMYENEKDTFVRLNPKEITTKKIDLNGVAGVELVSEGVSMNIKCRMFLVKNRMYKVQFLTMTGVDINSKEVLMFLDSFKLTGK